MKKRTCFKTFLALALAFTLLTVSVSAFAKPWKFGVMSDTQWTCPNDPAGQNPNAVSVSILHQINQQFINHGVEFVIQVGDLTENGNDADIAMRAQAANELYLAGIGFFPMRGNHETYGNPANNYGIPAFQLNFPQTRGLADKFGARHFSSPTVISTDLDGMSYSFDYGHPGDSARFVIIDNWVTPSRNVAPGNGYNYGYSIGDQQPWISHRLDKHSRGTEHAFVFSHQPLMAENHQDSPFTGYTDANPAMQNAFFASLQNNDVKYYISGHDHIHQRSIIASPDGASRVQEIIGASNSSKFYTPKALNDANWFGQKARETSLSQERYTVGYYIYTIDGPRVTVDYYSDDVGNWQSDKSYPTGPANNGTHITPTFNFVKKESWGYSLNGREFLVCQNGQPNCDSSYTQVTDSFHGTTAQILDGANGSTASDYNLRPLTKAVNTGWSRIDDWCETHPLRKANRDFDIASDIFSLWGMADLGSDHTDTFALSMSYNASHSKKHEKDLLILITMDENGRWVNAVDKNVGGTKNFVLGPYKPGYELGTYGIDMKNQTVWAVVNHAGDFAVAIHEEPSHGHGR